MIFMEKYMKKILILCLLTLSASILAAGRTNWAIPTQIDIERGGGFMIYGSFGNVANCTVGNVFYVRSDHPQYEKIYAAALTAFTAKKQIRAYIHACEPVTWYASSGTSYNILDLGSDFNIKN